jgi:hypothetical protein
VLSAAGIHAIVVAVTLLAVASCVLLQYEGLLLIWRWLSMHGGHRRVKVLYGIFSMLVLHMIEILVFATALWLLVMWPGFGKLEGQHVSGFFDYVYFSAVTYSTVGFGETWPVGPIRLLCAVEALSGLVLITWSASFTYLEMQRFWRPEE